MSDTHTAIKLLSLGTGALKVARKPEQIQEVGAGLEK